MPSRTTTVAKTSAKMSSTTPLKPKANTKAKASPKSTTKSTTKPTVTKPATKKIAEKATAVVKKAPAKAVATKTTKNLTKSTAQKGAGAAVKMDVEAAPETNGVKDNLVNGDPAPAAASSKKRKATEEPEPAPTKAAVAARPVKKARAAPKREPINQRPTRILNVFVFGEGSSGELGLGSAKGAMDVKRPRLNKFLLPDSVGVVQVAVGGMHCAALSHEGRILTWGVNDQGALGRDTKWDGGLKDADAGSDSDSDDDDTGLNPLESTPTAMAADAFPEGTNIVQVTAGDSCTYALTDQGQVYGWGTFRANEGILGFTENVQVQRTPMIYPELKNITRIEAGANHVLALDKRGHVYAWGAGQQNQLGRRVIERTKMNGLTPREFGLSSITYISCGGYHSFAMDKKGNVWAWGLNNYGETGIPQGAGDDGAAVLSPVKIDFFKNVEVVGISGGSHHSIATTKAGDCLVWGRVDGCQLGMKMTDLDDEFVLKDEREKPRVLTKPTKIPTLSSIVSVAAGSDTCIAINETGRAFSWGFSANYQTGQGTTEDIEVATLIDNTATRDKKLVWAGCGGQFSVVVSHADEEPKVNGVK